MDKSIAKTILEKTEADYDAVAEKYSTVRDKNWREMDFLFDKYLKEGDEVLDLGCGNGRFYSEFISRGANYWGADFSNKILSIAQQNHPEGNFVKANALELPFESDFFDKTYSIAVLHHIPSFEFRQQFLGEIVRVLKPDGELILTVWDLKEKRKKMKFNFLAWFWGLWMDKGDILLPWYGVKDAYFHCFTLEELSGLIESVGLKIMKKGEIMVGERPYNNFYIIAKKIINEQINEKN
jgi:ubiquinone/menaquinone biosynthesis C-methylase UbiE